MSTDHLVKGCMKHVGRGMIAHGRKTKLFINQGSYFHPGFNITTQNSSQVKMMIFPFFCVNNPNLNIF